MGARPLQRLIEKEILSKLSVKIITNEIVAGDRVEVNVDNNEFIINVLERGKA
jgi:ATP-dependent Clp protease ATP-binding subunit ClpA